MWALVVLMMSTLGSGGELSRECAELVGRMCHEVALTYFMECSYQAVVRHRKRPIHARRRLLEEVLANWFTRSDSKRLCLVIPPGFVQKSCQRSHVIMLALSAAVMFLSGAAHGLTNYATEELARMSREITSKHFRKSKCLALVTDHNNDIMDRLHPLDVPVLQVHLPFDTMKDSKILKSGFEEYTWDAFLLAPMDAGCLAFIVQTNDVMFMVKTFARLMHCPQSTYRANRKFLYLPSRQIPDDIFDKIIKEMFATREMDFMPDCVVAKLITEHRATPGSRGSTGLLTENLDTERNMKIELITHRFNGRNPSERVSLDVWVPEDGFMYQADLYPDKVTNLKGKTLSLTAIFYPPLSVVFEDSEPPVYDGLEFRVMYSWARQNNFTWRVVYEPDEWWGAIWENGSGVGLSGHVSMDKADVGFGAIYLWENEHRFTDYSSVYFRTSLTTVLPKPKLLPGWMVPIHPFSQSTWTAVGLSVVVSTLALQAASRASVRMLGSAEGKAVVNMYSTWVECAFRTVGLLVLQVPPDERDFSTPRHVPMRHLVTWLILFYFVVTTGYSAGLASVLTLPRYEPPIETPTEMADRNIKWGGTDVAYVFFLQQSLDPKMRILASNFIEGNEEYLAKEAATGEMGFVIERMQNGHFFLPPFINEDTMKRLRVMKEDYVYGHCVFMLRKGSPYMGIINSIVHKVRDTGLVLYWEDLTVRRYMSTRRQLSVVNSRKEVDPGPTQLLLRHVTGSFYLLGYGLALSLFVFITEIFIYTYRYLKLEITARSG